MAGDGNRLVPVQAVRRITSDARVVARKTAPELMLQAARLRRDGASREAIMVQLDVKGIVPLAVMDRFLDRAEVYLAQEIAAGRQSGESVTTLYTPAGDVLVPQNVAERIGPNPVIDIGELKPEDDADDPLAEIG